MAESYHRLESEHPGRFVLGVGIGHPERTREYKSPYETIVDYLDVLDEAKVPVDRRMLAALGPRVLKLSAARTAGALPYLTTPEHTRQAREIARRRRAARAGAEGGARDRRRDRPLGRRATTSRRTCS